MAKKPKLSGSTLAVMRKRDPRPKPSSWKLLWPTMKFGWNRYDSPARNVVATEALEEGQPQEG